MAELHKLTLIDRGELKNLWQMTVEPHHLMWRKCSSTRRIMMKFEEIVSLTWMPLRESFGIYFLLQDGSNYFFTDFKVEDQPWVMNIFEDRGITLKMQEFDVRGRNKGKFQIEGKTFTLLDDTMKKIFDVGLENVSKMKALGANNLKLYYHTDDSMCSTEIDSLNALTFHVPNASSTLGRIEDITPAHTLKEKISSNDCVRIGTEGAVVEFEKVVVISPKGIHDIKLMLHHFTLHGVGDREFTVLYRNIVDLFVLPKTTRHSYVVISLDIPLLYGSQPHSLIVLQFRSDSPIKKVLSMSPDLYESRFIDKLQKEYQGPVHEVMIQILEGLCNRKRIEPGGFRSSEGNHALKMKAGEESGLLFPLENMLLFLPKPPINVLHDEIDGVHLLKQDDCFTVDIELLSEKTHCFCSSQMNEFTNFLGYLRLADIYILNAPKSPGFIAFSMSLQESMKKDFPRHSKKSIRKMIEDKWNELSDVEKGFYEMMQDA